MLSSSYLCANPLAFGTCTSVALFWYGGTWWKSLPPQLTRTFIPCDALGFVQNCPRRAVTTFNAIFAFFKQFRRCTTDRLTFCWSAGHVNPTTSTFHCWNGKLYRWVFGSRFNLRHVSSSLQLIKDWTPLWRHSFT